jgi:cytochrome oxidase Cu insertion factor (SCO1/SenC/PrrC family)
MKRIAPATFLSLVLLGCAPTSHQPSGGDSLEQRAAKNKLEGLPPPALQAFDWTNTDGKELTLAALTGKVVVVFFWGVWNDESKQAIPKLKKLHDKHSKDGLVLIGIHSTRQGGKMADYVKAEGIAWPVAIDKVGETARAYHVSDFCDFYLIDRKGNLRIASVSLGSLERAVENFLKE